MLSPVLLSCSLGLMLAPARALDEDAARSVEPTTTPAVEPPAEGEPSADVPPEEEGDAPLTTTATAEVDTAAEPPVEKPPVAITAAAAEAPAAGAPAEKAKDKPAYEISGGPGKGVTISLGDPFSLNIRSRIQFRYQLVAPNDAEGADLQQTVNIGTARLWFSGHALSPKLQYMIQLAVAGRDFRDGATSPIFDAYVDWKPHRDISVRGGQYFVAFDRLRTVREWALQLADRPRPVGELTLDRDAGVTIYSDTFLGDKSPVAYRIGAFGGGGTNATTGKRPGGLFVGRLELRPLGPVDDDIEGDQERRKKPALAIGGAFAANIHTNRLRSTTGATFTGGTTHYFHGAADLVFKWRGWALQAEYLRKQASTNAIESVDDAGDPLVEYTRSAQGWVAQTSYLFSVPVELVGRMSAMYALGATDPALIADLDARGQEVAGGINYYFNGHRLKLQADWIALMPRDFQFSAADHIVHFQLDVTF